jgi:hypothetical protein
MINVNGYLKSSGIKRMLEVEGGQELLLWEIIGALWGLKKIYIPFLSSATLAWHLKRMGFDVWIPISNTRIPDKVPEGFEAVYFGTPTIVNDKPLFPESGWWNKNHERVYVRDLCREVKDKGYKRIVSGLGSGDISVDERLEDMGGGKIACFKDFGEFQDWVLVREL